MRMKAILFKAKTRFAIVAAFAGAIVLPAVMFTGNASADAFYNYNGNNGQGYCLSTQGSTVNSYENDGNCYTPYIDWSFLNAGGGFSEIESQNWSRCIGDYGNNSGRADAALDECPTQGNAGWGTKFYYGSCSNGLGSGYYFVNYHWNGWLGPQNWNNGAQEYLNKPSGWCFYDDPYQ